MLAAEQERGAEVAAGRVQREQCPRCAARRGVLRPRTFCGQLWHVADGRRGSHCHAKKKKKKKKKNPSAAAARALLIKLPPLSLVLHPAPKDTRPTPPRLSISAGPPSATAAVPKPQRSHLSRVSASSPSKSAVVPPLFFPSSSSSSLPRPSLPLTVNPTTLDGRATHHRQRWTAAQGSSSLSL